MNNPDSALGSNEIQSFLSSQFHDMGNFVVDLPFIVNSGYDPKQVFGSHRHSRIIFIENPNSDIGHFTLLTDMGDHFEWFDSTGQYPPDELIQFAAHNNKPLRGLQPHYRLQGPESFVCGKWCILRYLSLPTSMMDFCNIFHKNLKGISPDSVVDKLVQVKIKDE